MLEIAEALVALIQPNNLIYLGSRMNSLATLVHLQVVGVYKQKQQKESLSAFSLNKNGFYKNAGERELSFFILFIPSHSQLK